MYNISWNNQKKMFIIIKRLALKIILWSNQIFQTFLFFY